MKLKAICSLVAIILLAATVDASAQDKQELKKTVVLDNIRTTVPRQRPESTRTTDHRQTKQTALEKITNFKQWMIGANRKSNVDGILTRGVNPRTTPQSFYNLKGLRNKRFLQYERQGKGRGINIGWTDNANAETANGKAHWGIFPEAGDPRRPNSGSVAASTNGVRQKPIVYGEIVAIAWWPPNPRRYSEFSAYDGRHVPQFLTYASRNVGPNLEWSSHGASYEWVILGGEPGTTVRRGQDTVVLFNLKNKKPLLYGSRQFGAHLGFLGYSAFNAPVVVGQTEVTLAEWRSLMLKPAQDATR